MAFSKESQLKRTVSKKKAAVKKEEKGAAKRNKGQLLIYAKNVGIG